MKNMTIVLLLLLSAASVFAQDTDSNAVIAGTLTLSPATLALLTQPQPQSQPASVERDDHPFVASVVWNIAPALAGAFDILTTNSWSSRPKSAFKYNTCTEGNAFLANDDGTANGPKSVLTRIASVAWMTGALYITKTLLSRWKISEWIMKSLIMAQTGEWTYYGVRSLVECR